MRISLNWLREFVDIDPNVDTLAHELTMLGLEIEAIEHLGAGLSHVVVGQIKTIEPHPDADKLVVCTTDVPTVAELIDRIVAEAEAVLARLTPVHA